MHSHFYTCLSRYQNDGYLRLHMPGHAGTLSPFDVTELGQTDDLLDPVVGGALHRDELDAAALFGARLSLFSAGGATLCLQTALLYQLRFSDRARQGFVPRVLCERGVHRSILHALALLDVQPIFIPSAEALCKDDVQEGDLLVFSGCDYFGKIPDYARLSVFCRENGLLTVVDNAHGTHLRFLDGGSKHPLTYGFDLVVDSAHKTLCTLTGAAILHVGSTLVGEVEQLRSELLHAMRQFSTTSPNYLIILSLCEALCRIAVGFDGQNYAPFLQRAQLIARLAKACGLHALGQDPMRLALCGGFDFLALKQRLESERIAVELARKNAMVLLFGEDFDTAQASRLEAALSRHLKDCVQNDVPREPSESAARVCMSLREALFAPAQTLRAEEAVGRIAAEVVGNYPPGTALCMPGEVLEESVLQSLEKESVRVVKAKEENL